MNYEPGAGEDVTAPAVHARSTPVPASRRRSFRTGAAALVAVTTLAAGASAADAGVLVASAPSCDDQALSKPFAPWLDYADYTPLAGGDFESASQPWSTNGPASVVSGNEPFRVGRASDGQSLALQNNSSATSPAVCVGIEHPTIRFFAKRRSTGLLASLSTLHVEALFELVDGTVAPPVPVGVVSNGAGWQPTVPMAIVANLLALLPGQHTPVAFRFSAVGGDWSIDDAWIDPYGRKP
jgi:hypothetical protein